MISPASPSAPTSSLDGQLLPGAIGGNLARVTCNALSSQTGHLLFKVTQRVEKLLREHGSGDPSLREGSTARAALTGARRNAAKSLSLPFHHVDHFTHRGAPIFVDETKFNRSSFA